MRKGRLDKINLRILDALSRNSRMSRINLSEYVGLSWSPLWERIKRLERSGYISGYHAHVDLSRVVPSTMVWVTLHLDSMRLVDLTKFETAIRGVPEVALCHSLTGESDYSLLFFVRDMNHFTQLMQELLAQDLGIVHYRSHLVNHSVVENAFNMSRYYIEAARQHLTAPAEAP